MKEKELASISKISIPRLRPGIERRIAMADMGKVII